jgi:hypothetical protein
VDSPPWQCPCAWHAKSSVTKNGPYILFTWLRPLRVLAVSKIEKNALKGQRFDEIPWHPTQRDNFTARYSGKRFSRLFLAVAPSSYEVDSFTRRIFRRWQ